MGDKHRVVLPQLDPGPGRGRGKVRVGRLPESNVDQARVQHEPLAARLLRNEEKADGMLASGDEPADPTINKLYDGTPLGRWVSDQSGVAESFLRG